jgi:tetratricopeptide (TPR) repeat protein
VITLVENGSQNVGSLYVNSLINMGICYKITEQYEKAIGYYERATKIDPNDESIIYNQAMAYMAILQTLNTDIFY